MARTCFILDELYPEDRGGIARLMHNLLQQAKQDDPAAELHVVLAQKPPKSAPQNTRLQAAFEGIAHIHYFRTDFEVAERFGLGSLKIEALFDKQAAPALRDYCILDAVLQAASQFGPFDHIEIPDHMGLGAIVLQAKRAGYGFENTEITCRIHSSLSAIISAEPFHHAQSSWLAPRLEMERFALEHADRVIAHLPCIAEFNQKHFGFAAGWLDKVDIAFPPVIWPVPTVENTPGPDEDSPRRGGDFIFTSRFQPFKRPDLFIKAAITMLDGGSDFAGCFRLISYGFDRDYIDLLRMSVPRRYRQRIRIETNISAEERTKAIQTGIVVQPSKFESLCALAYEASVAGRPLLLAADCAAFGKDPHWINGENCLLFAPTPAALAKTMERARSWRPTCAVETKPDPLYFLPPARTQPRLPVVSLGVVIGPFTQAGQLADLTPALTALDVPVRAYGLPDLKAEAGALSYHRVTDADYTGHQLQKLAHTLKTDAVVLCTPEAVPRRPFLNLGARTVQPGVAFSSQSHESATRQMRLYPGQHNSMSLVEPRICPPCVILHKTDISLIGPHDDTELMPRLLARLARSKVELRLCPAPYIVEQNPAKAPPSSRILGYEAAPVWKAGLRWIGVGVAPATRSGIVAHAPLVLQGEGAVCLTGAAPTEIAADAAAQAFYLRPDLPTANGIIALTPTYISGDSAVTLSLHQTRAEIALKAHAQGANCQSLQPGQHYQMRWGPIWQPDHLTLVVSSAGAAKLKIENPLLISRI